MRSIVETASGVVVTPLKPSDGFREFVHSTPFQRLKSLDILSNSTHEHLARALTASPRAPALTSFLLRRTTPFGVECAQQHDDALINTLLTREASRHLEHIRLQFFFDRDRHESCPLQSSFELLPNAHIERIKTLMVQHDSLSDEAVKGIFSRRDLHQVDELSFSSSSLTAAIFHDLPDDAAISQIRDLNLSRCALRGEDFPDPKQTRPAEFSLRRFNASYNQIDAKAMQWFLRRGLLSRVEELNLSGNQLSNSEDWRELEHDRPVSMHALRKLSLVGTKISADGLRWFARHGLGEVEELDLSSNWFGDEALKVLVEEVDWKRLRVLKLGRNKLTDASLSALATSDLLLGLQELDLSGNRFVGEKVSPGSTPLSYPLLRTLELGENPWSSRGYELMLTWPWLNHVSHVSLSTSSRAHSEYKWTQILEVAARAPLHPTTLTIDDEHLSDAGLSRLARAPWLRHIKELHLQGVFDGHTLVEIADAMTSGNLLYLDLDSPNLSPHSASKLADHPSMKSLKYAEIDYNPSSRFLEGDYVMTSWLSSPNTQSLVSLETTTICEEVSTDQGTSIYAHSSPHMQKEKVANALAQRPKHAPLMQFLMWDYHCPDMNLLETLEASDAIDPFLRESYRFLMGREAKRQESQRQQNLNVDAD